MSQDDFDKTGRFPLDKISGILPSNSRLKSVDMKGAHPVRPGVPTYGNPTGSTSSIRDRISISAQNGEGDSVTYRNPREAYHSQIAEQMSKKFFDTRLKPTAEESSEFSTEIAGSAPELVNGETQEKSNTSLYAAELPEAERNELPVIVITPRVRSGQSFEQDT